MLLDYEFVKIFEIVAEVKGFGRLKNDNYLKSVKRNHFFKGKYLKNTYSDS